MIEVKNIVKRLGANKVLDDISFSVKKGEVLGFLGPNGAGKTTTLKIITSFWSPDKGSISIDGNDVTKDSLKTRQKIGYLPEMVPLYREMKVFEYLKFVASVRGLGKEEQKKRIKEVSNSCGLEEVIGKPIDELSKGYQQRLGLAQAIIHNPEVLILDEPTTGLDPNQIVEIRDLIKKIGEEKTVIFSTHILGEVSSTCNRAIIIDKGKIKGEGSPDELTKNLGGGQKIYVKIKGFKEEVLNKLKEVENIENIEIKDKESDRIYGYEIEPKEGVDIREHLSRLVTHSGWSILEFNQKQASLEEVFRQLTK